MKPLKEKFPKIRFIKPIAFGLILLAALIFLLLWERENMYRQASRSVYNTAENLAKTLQGVIQFQYKCGRSHALDQILENIMSFSDIKYILLRLKEREIMEVGGEYKFPKVDTPEGFELIGDKFYYWTNLNSRMIFVLPAIVETDSHSHNVIQSFTISAKSASPDLFFGIIIEDKEYFSQVKESNIKLSIVFVCGLFAILILVFSWIHFIRNSELKLEFSEIKKKNEYLSELSFAASGLAHETKNPLGIIRGLAQTIKESKETASLPDKKIASKIIDEIDIVTERLSDFMNYACTNELKKEPVSLRNVIEEVGGLMRYDFEKAGITLETNLDDITTVADREAVIQIIVNLLLNSINASSKESSIYIYLVQKGEFAELSVIDHGSGIEPGIIKDIFKPYVSNRKNGHGIGLAIVKKLLDELKWDIGVSTEPGKGTSMIVSNIKIV